MPETGDPILPLPLPRGVADPTAATGYVSDADGAVVAIALADGRSVWRSGVVARPVLAAAGRVFAVRPGDRDAPGVLHLEVLDAASGKRTGGAALGPPGDAPASVPSPDLDLFPTLVGAVFRLTWRLRGGYGGGAPPPEHVRERFESSAAGLYEYDVEAKTVTPRPAPEAVRAPPDLPSWPYRRDEAWRRTAWPVAGGLARLELDESRRPPVLRLELWDRAGTARSRATELLEGPALEPTVTSDGGHLFLRRTAPPGDRWHVYGVASGRALAALPYEEGSRLPAVVGERAFYLVWPPGGRGAAIRAVELASGRTLWSHPLAETAGARPPPLPR